MYEHNEYIKIIIAFAVLDGNIIDGMCCCCGFGSVVGDKDGDEDVHGMVFVSDLDNFKLIFQFQQERDEYH